MTQPALRDFDRSLPMALLKAREAVMRKFLPALRENGLSAQQWRVIRALMEENKEEENGLDATQLTQRCYLLGPSLSRILQNLESREIIDRQSSPTDNRRAIIRLTAAGRALFEQIAPRSAERYDHIAEAFGYGKLELLYELLDELVEKLDDADETDEAETPA